MIRSKDLEMCILPQAKRNPKSSATTPIDLKFHDGNVTKTSTNIVLQFGHLGLKICHSAIKTRGNGKCDAGLIWISPRVKSKFTHPPYELSKNVWMFSLQVKRSAFGTLKNPSFLAPHFLSISSIAAQNNYSLSPSTTDKLRPNKHVKRRIAYAIFYSKIPLHSSM